MLDLRTSQDSDCITRSVDFIKRSEDISGFRNQIENISGFRYQVITRRKVDKSKV